MTSELACTLGGPERMTMVSREPPRIPRRFTSGRPISSAHARRASMYEQELLDSRRLQRSLRIAAPLRRERNPHPDITPPSDPECRFCGRERDRASGRF